MAIATTLQEYLSAHDVDYDLVPHPYTVTSTETAQAAHVPGDRIAKAVVLEDDQGYLMAVIPASRHVALGKLHTALHRNLGLATEEDLKSLFRDCELGAIPPVADAYGMASVLDDSLVDQPDIYFEAGDHEELVHMSGAQFRALMKGADVGEFGARI